MLHLTIYHVVIIVAVIGLLISLFAFGTFFIREEKDVYVTDFSTNIFGGINKNIEMYIKDSYGSYASFESDRVYAYRKAKRVFKNIYYVKYNRIVFKNSEVHNLIDAKNIIKSRKGVNKFKL